ncbi:MAG: carbon-nitrogen hydrolase family protein [Caldilineales bacterium]|nr:carbon-nitrogen hydrolase family protein [Caldilineales bacterium]MDW8319499.1 carbon-nitrogen hydrolase family protein [Anaerolineae bacterium]
MRQATIALVQSKPILGDIEENLRRMAEFVDRICKEQPVDLIVFPELATTGYECGPRFTELAEYVPGHTVNYLAKRAGEYHVHIAFGMVLKERVESILYDAAVLLGPEGELVGSYRKVHLKGEERLAFRNGYRFVTFDVEFRSGPSRLGLLIDWDLAFPEAARCLTLDGAEVIAISANWQIEENAQWRAFNLARACENGVFVAAANRAGEEPSYAFCGDSMIVGPNAELYTNLEDPVEGYAVATVDLDEVRRTREASQILQCRQPLAYRNIVRKY